MVAYNTTAVRNVARTVSNLGCNYAHANSDHLDVQGELFGQIGAHHHQAVCTYRNKVERNVQYHCVTSHKPFSDSC